MRILVVAGVVLVLFPLGTATALPKKELASAADDICLKYAKKAKRLKTGDLSRHKAAVRYFRKLYGLARAQQKEFAALKADVEVRRLYRRFLRVGRRIVRVLRDLRDAVVSRDERRSQRFIRKLPSLAATFDRVARRLGALRCVG